jgi:hypothetical protein
MRLPIAAAAFAAATAAHAQRAPDPLWEVGGFAFGISQQAYPGADEQVNRGFVLPYFLYRGELLRVDRDGAGIRPVKRPAYELDIGFAGSFGSSSDDIEARRGMPDLGTLVEAGPRLVWKLAGPDDSSAPGRWRLELPLRGVFDLDDGLAYRGLSFDPQLEFALRDSGGLTYNASAGLLFLDQRMADTFYGVAPVYATADRAAYEARAGLAAVRLGLRLSQVIGADWRWFGFLNVDSVVGAANRASPLVRQSTGATLGVGMIWTWMRSEHPAVD